MALRLLSLRGVVATRGLFAAPSSGSPLVLRNSLLGQVRLIQSGPRPVFAARRAFSDKTGAGAGSSSTAEGANAAEAAAATASQQTTAISTEVTFAEKAKTGVRLGFWVGLAGFASMCAYLIGKELIPTRMSPNSIFSDTAKIVQTHPEITARLGTPVKAYGRDFGSSREGRRNFVDHDEYTDIFGVKRMRIKFNLEGPNGKAKVYSEIRQDALPSEFEYIIFERVLRGRREAIALEDNRSEPSTEKSQAAVVERFNKYGVMLYGKDSGCEWTKKQKDELGSFGEKLKYIACDKPENKDACAKAGLKYVPAWGQVLQDGTQDISPGFHSLEQLVDIAKRLQ